jgi:toxin ParE1/3/4
MKLKSIVILESAKRDIEQADFWYESKRKGLGDYFLSQLELALEDIQKNPLGYEAKHNLTREKLMRKFPFLVTFKIEESTINVVRIFPCKSDPSKK